MDQQLLNRRDTLRMAQPDGCVEAKLKVRNRISPCIIVDESAGGYLISGKKFPMTPPTEPVELHTSAGRHALRVVWRRKVDDEIHIGLQRLPDEFLWRQDSSWMIWMVLAILVGFGGGYLFAFRDRPMTMRIVDRVSELSGSQISNSLVTDEMAEPDETQP
jgi:hypothetical protein